MSKSVFTVYKTTNQVNSRFYIGVHKTSNPNDQYLGSGKLINTAIKKYGRENFRKEVLFSFETAEEAYAKEAELVNTTFVNQDETYNLMVGGVYSHSDKYGQPGESNSQHGTVWVCKQGLPPKKIPGEVLDPHLSAGWSRGRSIKKGRQPREKKLPPRSSKLSFAVAEEIRTLYRTGGIAQHQLAKQFQVSQPNICMIITGRIWPPSAPPRE